MSLATITPAQRVMLDRRIAEEAMLALNPPFERPDWLCDALNLSAKPIAFVMGADGVVAPRWQLIDEVDWHRVCAVRLETSFGLPVSIETLGDNEDDY